MSVSTNLKSYELYSHQKRAVEFIVENDGSAGLWVECGLGKTLIAIEAIKRYKKINPSFTALVVCPLSLIHAAWIEDLEKFSNLTHQSLRERKQSKADVYIINYESYAKKKVPADMIILDESSKIKNYSSGISKRLIKDRYLYRHRLCLSGTPAPNTELEFWPQVSFISATSLPESFYKFRNLFFHLQRGEEIIPFIPPAQLSDMFRRGFKYQLKPSMRQRFFDSIADVSFWAKKKDCLDLPDKVFERRDVYLSAAQMKAYKDMKNHMIAVIKEEMIVATVALTKMMKLRQITSGFAIDQNGEATALQDNAKLNVLLELLENIGNKQVIIFCQFHQEIETLVHKLEGCATLYGKTEDRDDSITGFKSGKYKYLVGHPRSMAHGLSFTNCDTTVFYSNDYSFEMREQAINRIHRATTTKKCTYYDLVAKDTIDEAILEVLTKKEDAQALYELCMN